MIPLPFVERKEMHVQVKSKIEDSELCRLPLMVELPWNKSEFILVADRERYFLSG